MNNCRGCSRSALSAAALLFLFSGAAAATLGLPGVTRLAEGAVRGENVHRPVPGFEIQILHHGKEVYHRAFGAWRLDQPAQIDSCSKTLAGALVMSVAQSGERGFSLDSKLGDYLPGFAPGELAPITIRQAFSHTSGISGRDVGSLILRARRITLKQSAAMIARKPLEHGPPGDRFAYGGLSMQAAGAAAEAAAGVPYAKLFAERITGPLEMHSTKYTMASELNPRVAGGVRSTAADFGRFMDMLLNHGVDRPSGRRVLTADSVDEMLRRQTSDQQTVDYSPTDNHRYGIGVWLGQLADPGPSVDALAGGARGFHSWIDRERSLVFTLATDKSSFQNLAACAALMRRALVAELPATGGRSVGAVAPLR